MGRQTIKMTTLVILLSALSVATEFTVYYFVDELWPILALTAAASLLFSHILLEASLSYESGLLFSCLSMILSTIAVLLIYLTADSGLFTYRGGIRLVICIQWLVPMAYYVFRCLLDRGPRFVAFNSFFQKSSALFAIYYVATLAYFTAIRPITPPYAFLGNEGTAIPFLATATHIEDFIYTGSGLLELLAYIAKILLLFAPMGFYAALLLRKFGPWPKAALLLLAPLAFEYLSFLCGMPWNIDSCLYRFAAIGLGMLLFQAIDRLFRRRTGEPFLFERNRYSFFLR